MIFIFFSFLSSINSLIIVILFFELISLFLFVNFSIWSYSYNIDFSNLTLVLTVLTRDGIIFLVVFILIIRKNYNDRSFIFRKF